MRPHLAKSPRFWCLRAWAGAALVSAVVLGSNAHPLKAEGVGTGETGRAKSALLVLPFQAIFRSVPQPKLDSAMALLEKELEQRDGLRVVRGAVGAPEPSEPPPDSTLETAQQATSRADKAEASRAIGAALEARKQAVKAYEQNARALDDPTVYFLARHALARTYLLAGRDAEARAEIAALARMVPSLIPPKDIFPRIYQRWLAATARSAAAEPRGKLRVESPLPGAKIWLDGREMDVAPVELDNVVPGQHLLSVHIEGVPAFAVLVDVPSGHETAITAAFSKTTGGSAVGLVTGSIAQNMIPAAAVESAVSAGKAANADYVLLGGMAKDGERFRVHSYVVNVAQAKIAPLEEVSFDLDLLTAESDVLKIVQATQNAIEHFPAGESQVLSLESRIKARSNLNHVDASPLRLADGQPTPPSTDKKVRNVVKPLKGGTISIKGEDD